MQNGVGGVRMGERRSVYFSFYRLEDQTFKSYAEKALGELFTDRTPERDELDPEDREAYARQLIAGGHLDRETVVVVLVGKSTRYRMQIDWDIHTALEPAPGMRCGLVGVLLPTLEPLSLPTQLMFLPPRLRDNHGSGYARLYGWETFLERFSDIIEEAYRNRTANYGLAENGRTPMRRNGPE